MSTAWRKVWRDTAHNKTRTLLAVLSIAAGVFALGLAFGAHGVMHARLEEDRRTTRPAHITFRGGAFGRDTFDQETVDAVLREPGVADAAGETSVPFRWAFTDSGDGETDWRQGLLVARADYEAQRINRVELLDGHWPVERTLAVERLSSHYFDVDLGTTIRVEFGQSAGKGERRLPVEGIVRQPCVLPPQFDGPATFFATPETATWLTGSDGFNKLRVRLASLGYGDVNKKADEVGRRVRDRLERLGLSAGNWNATGVEDEFDFQELPEIIDALSLILMVLGGLSLGLSTFLIVNTMNAIVAQQVWQIGVMKVLGATGGRVARIYLTTALVYGGLALLLAVPLGAVGAHLLAGWMLEIFNVIATGVFQVSPIAVAVQVVVGLVVPLLAAVVPVIGGARISPHQAISSYGLGGRFGRGMLDRLVGRVRRLPRPLALSLRNTFRRKVRVVLTLFTLTFVGVMFIMVMSVRVSLDSTVERILEYWGYDVMVVFSRPYRVAHLVEVTESMPGVTRVEVWNLRNAQLLLAAGPEQSRRDGAELEVGVYGRPPDSEMFTPNVVSGRGLLPDDGYAILLDSQLAADQSIQVGDEIMLSITGEETTWTVVGLNTVLGFGDNFVPFDTLARETGNVNRGGLVMVTSEEHSPEAQERLVDALSDVYTARHIEAKSFMSANEFRERGQELFDVLSYLLLTMAILAAVVGSIGLMGTLSINVVERRREIGVMRAIGATSPAITGIFVGEGVFLGLLSWLLAAPLSYPGARLFSDAIGAVMFDMSLDFSYSVTGAALWLAIVLALSALASLWPALQATRVSVREALAYE